MQPPQSFLIKLFYSGVNDQNSTIFNGRLSVQNAFALVSTIFAFPFIAMMIYLGHLNVALIFLLIQFGLMISIWLNKKQRYTPSKILLLFVVSSALPVLSASLGFKSGFYLYFFLTPLFSLSLYDFSDMRKILIAALIFLTSFIFTECLYFFNFPSIVSITQEVQLFLFHANLTVGLIIITIISYNIVKLHQELSLQVLDMNKGLYEHQQQQEKIINQKNVLLGEVHHRVKNNLAVISSLFNLQLNQIENSEAREILRSNANRIKSMSLVHNSLYKFDDVSKIEMDKYIKNLATELANSYMKTNGRIELVYSLDKFHLELERAVPCGMLVNEILVNSFKHAFNESDGEINIGLMISSDTVTLTISDTGQGFDQKHDLKQESLGLILIDSLVSQLDGKFQLSTESGTRYEIVFGR